MTGRLSFVALTVVPPLDMVGGFQVGRSWEITLAKPAIFGVNLHSLIFIILLSENRPSYSRSGSGSQCFWPKVCGKNNLNLKGFSVE